MTTPRHAAPASADDPPSSGRIDDRRIVVSATGGEPRTDGGIPRSPGHPLPSSSVYPTVDPAPSRAGATPTPEAPAPDDERAGAGRSGFLHRSRAAVLLAVPLVLVLLVGVGWAADAIVNSGEVARNVVVLGTDVGGLDRGALLARLDDVAADYGATPVVLHTTSDDIETTAGAIGIALDVDRTADSAMDARKGNIVVRPFRWLGAFFATTDVTPSLQLVEPEGTALDEIVASAQPDPTEPTLTVADGEVVIVAGVPARSFDVDEIRTDTLAAATSGSRPIEVQIGSGEIPPSTDDRTAQQWADDLNALTADGITVTARDESTDIDAATLRSWMTFDNTGREGEVPEWTLDPERVESDLRARITDLAPPEIDGFPEIIVRRGNLRIPALRTQVCCGPDAGAVIREAVLAGDDSVEVPLTNSDELERAKLDEVGVVELVSRATTPHNCCESRVINIHRIADLMRGIVVQPGESLSINDTVGRRTIENGFVESGVIYLGELSTDVGGGISQFATTFFQAMFYGGYDIDSYFPHTLFFDRYVDFAGRRGIESTISYPEPDLAITNNTEYPVLIWPTYTDTSLTVSLYSTKTVETEVARQDEYATGACTTIDTYRERTYPDGETEVDTFRATYQPSDGIGCDGKPTNPESVTPTPVPTRPNRPNRPNRPGNGAAEPTPAPTTDPAPEPTPDAAAEPTPDPGTEPTTVPAESPTPPTPAP